MRKQGLILGMIFFMSACSLKSTKNTGGGGALSSESGTPSSSSTDLADKGENLDSPPDIPSFRLSDPEAPQVVDDELERIPTDINPMVEKWIAYFQGRGREHMERYLARSTRYEKIMKKVLRDNGLPDDLFYIALIESGFNGVARSHAAAVGYWQFIRGTGKRYGLTINSLVDERRDPVLATQAAADYFKGLYSAFGSWYLAMASYNVGENRVKKSVMKYATRDFWELTTKRKALPAETNNYIPKFIAAKLIGQDPAKYGFEDIDYLPPIEFDHVAFEKPVNLRVMAEKMNYNYEDFKALNPKYKGEIAPLAANNKLELRVPPGMIEVAMNAGNESYVERAEFIADTGDTQTYRIRRGDTLNVIARKFRTNVAYLRDLNDIPRGKRLRPGMSIYVPDRTPISFKRAVAKSDTKGKKEKDPANSSEALNSSDNRGVSERASRHLARSAESIVQNLSTQQNLVSVDGGGKFHIVQSGDSLYSIAQKYSVKVNDLRSLNNLKKGRLLKVGIKLRLPGDVRVNENKEDSKNKQNSVGSGSNNHVELNNFNFSYSKESKT